MGFPSIQPGTTPLVRYEMEYLPSSQIMHVPGNIKALFALFVFDAEKQNFNVMYVGYANNENGNTIRSLLMEQQKLNGRMWSHFSVYELWDFLQENDDRAVEMLFRQIYRRDAQYKRHLAGDHPAGTQDNMFVPYQLFTSFIKKISRTSTQLVDSTEQRARLKTQTI